MTSWSPSWEQICTEYWFYCIAQQFITELHKCPMLCKQIESKFSKMSVKICWLFYWMWSNDIICVRDFCWQITIGPVKIIQTLSNYLKIILSTDSSFVIVNFFPNDSTKCASTLILVHPCLSWGPWSISWDLMDQVHYI